jgi:hypothetical protein
LHYEITFTRLPKIDPNEIISHMSNPRIPEHMPLLTFAWDDAAVAKFISTKEEYWNRDGLGHWALLINGEYDGREGFKRREPIGTMVWFLSQSFLVMKRGFQKRPLNLPWLTAAYRV